MIMTTEQIMNMNSEELRKQATKSGIKNAKTFKKEVLVQMVLDALEDVLPPVEEAKVEVVEEEVKTTVVEKKEPAAEKKKEKTLPIDQKQIDAIVGTDKLTKSAKFIKLSTAGLSPAQVAEAMSCNYSFVYGVLSREKKKQLVVTT